MIAIRERVEFYIRDHDNIITNEELYRKFPDVKKNTLIVYKRNFLNSINKNTTTNIDRRLLPHPPKKTSKKKIFLPNEEEDENENDIESQFLSDQKKTIDELDPELIKDIRKIKCIMGIFGENVRLNEVVAFLREMNQLKPSSDETILQSLKNKSIEELSDFILEKKYFFEQTRLSTLDNNIIRSLREESDT